MHSNYKIWNSDSALMKISNFGVCDNASIGRWSQTFRSNVFPPSSGLSNPRVVLEPLCSGTAVFRNVGSNLTRRQQNPVNILRFTFRYRLHKQTGDESDNTRGSHTDVYYVTSIPNSTYRYKNSRKFVTFHKTVFSATSVTISDLNRDA